MAAGNAIYLICIPYALFGKCIVIGTCKVSHNAEELRCAPCQTGKQNDGLSLLFAVKFFPWNISWVLICAHTQHPITQCWGVVINVQFVHFYGAFSSECRLYRNTKGGFTARRRTNDDDASTVEEAMQIIDALDLIAP